MQVQEEDEDQDDEEEEELRRWSGWHAIARRAGFASLPQTWATLIVAPDNR